MALVEATGLEPVSKHILQKLSTCLFRFRFRELTGTKGKPLDKLTTDKLLSCIVLGNKHSLLLQHSVLFLSRRRGVVTELPARRPK